MPSNNKILTCMSEVFSPGKLTLENIRGMYGTERYISGNARLSPLSPWRSESGDNCASEMSLARAFTLLHLIFFQNENDMARDIIFN